MTPEEYKTKLNIKLTALIAILVITIKKIETSIDTPGVNVERMKSIKNSLSRTLSICEHAKFTITTQSMQQKSMRHTPSGAREYIEMTSLDEYRKFQNMTPISQEEIADVDWNQLMDQLKDV